MAAQTEDRENSRRSKAGGRKLRIALTLLGSLLLVGGIGLLAGRWSGESLERRIAAVNARDVLAPEENAATRYDQLAASSVLTGDPADPQLAPAALPALIEDRIVLVSAVARRGLLPGSCVSDQSYARMGSRAGQCRPERYSPGAD